MIISHDISECPCLSSLRCIECVLFIDDFSPTRVPNSSGKKFYVLGPARGSPSRSSLEAGGATTPSGGGGGSSSGGGGGPSQATTPIRETAEEKSRAARTKIKRIMKEFVLGDLSTGGAQGDSLTLSECLQVMHHRTVRNHLLLVYLREVLIIDLDIGQTIGIVTVDRGSPPILQAYASAQRDVIFLLNESGTLSLRVRKKLYNVASTPMEPIRNLSKSVSTTSITTTGSVDGVSMDNYAVENILEIVYEQKAYSEGIRLPKNAKILGMAANPISDKNFAMFTTDGRIFFLNLSASSSSQQATKRPQMCLDDLLPSVLDIRTPSAESDPSLKLLTSGILSGLALPPFVVRMCPPLTMKNLNEYIPYMAIGASNGNVQIANMSTGKIEREFAVHTFPVRGIEWTGLGSILSHAHQNLSGSSGALVRNELIHTDIRTGKTSSLRSHRSEEPPIDMLRVSHLKQYFIVAFIGAPFELWDLKGMALLRTMPKKFPPITALDWSPLHNLKSLKKKMNAIEDKTPEESKGHGNRKINGHKFVHVVTADSEIS